jgi:hypothetical protein
LCRGQLGHEGGVLGCGEALFQDHDQAPPIFDKKRIGVEPKAWENLRSIDSVRAGRPLLELIAAAGEPIDRVRVERDDDVLYNPGPLIVGLLRVQVVLTGGASDFDDQLGRTYDVTVVVHRGLATQLTWNPKLTTGLRFARGVEFHGPHCWHCRRLACIFCNKTAIR